MELQSPFRVVTTAVDGDVLARLGSVQTPLTIARLSDLIPDRSPRGIRDAADRLVTQGIVTLHRLGTSHAYELNDEHLASGAVRALASLRGAFIERLRAHVSAWTSRPHFAALFGSAARGDMRPDSDIDILLVRPEAAESNPWDADVADLTLAVTSWTGNDTRIVELSIDELASSDVLPLLREVARDGMPFAGEIAEFRRTVIGGHAA